MGMSLVSCFFLRHSVCLLKSGQIASLIYIQAELAGGCVQGSYRHA